MGGILIHHWPEIKSELPQCKSLTNFRHVTCDDFAAELPFPTIPVFNDERILRIFEWHPRTP